MAQSILIFDFGTNEEAAQQARHKLEGWKQAFRLGNKVALKFEREETEKSEGADADESKEQPAAKPATGKSKSGAGKKKRAEKAAKSADPEPPARVQLLIKLNFSDHEKLSHQRWLERIPTEEPFKSAKPEIIRHSDDAFAKASERFDSLS